MSRIHGVLTLTSIYFVVELVVGLWLGSLTLRADAFHMLSDMIALSIGIWAHGASQRPATDMATFGWSRTTVVGGLINVAFLLGNAFSIFTEAITQFFEDQNEDLLEKGNATTLIIVAGVGLLINLVGMCLLTTDGSSHGQSHGHSHGANHNTRAILLHLMADLFGSIAALASSLILRYWRSWDGRAIVDPILSLVVVGLISASAIPVLKDTVHILLLHSPKDADTDVLRKEISALPGVDNVHHIHLWILDPSTHVASLHVHPTIDHQATPSLHALRRSIQGVLHRHGFHSTTIQFDHAPGEPCEVDCSTPCTTAQCCRPCKEEEV